MDTEIYLFQAEQLIKGNWMGNDVFFQSGFIYPYFLAFFQILFGPILLPVKIVQIIFDSFSAVLLLILARRFFGARAGFIAGLGYAVYGSFIAGSVQPLIDLPILFPLLSGLLLYLHAGANKKSGLMITAGFLLGIVIVTRPYLLPLIPVLFVYALRWDKNEGLFKRLRLSIMVSIGILLIIAPVLLRNRIVGKEWVLTNAGGGWVFYLGNNPEAVGGFYIPEGMGIDENPFRYAASTLNFPSSELGHQVTWSEASDFWFKKGLFFWKERPGDALLLTLKKTGLCFNNYEVPDNFNFNYLKMKLSYLKFPWLGFGIIAPFGILGMVLNRKRFSELILLYSIVFLVALSQILIMVYTRHRYVLAAMLIFFGSSAAARIWEWRDKKQFKNIFLSVIALSIMTAFTYRHADIADVRFKSALGLANSLFNAGRIEEAYNTYEESLRLNPNFLDGARYYAISLASRGETKRAIEVLTTMIDRTSSFPQGHQMIKDIYKGQPPFGLEKEYQRVKSSVSSEDDVIRLLRGYFREKRFLEAREIAEGALKKHRGSGRLFGQLAYAEDHLGNFGQAAELYQKAYSLEPHETGWAGNREVTIGFLSLMRKDLKTAEETFRKAVSLDPESAEAYYGLGVVLKKTGRIREAVESYQKSIGLAMPHDRWIERAKEDIEAIQAAGR